jgi:uncharacterized cupin superfamily protein
MADAEVRMSLIHVVSSNDRDGWTTLEDPPGAIPSSWRELEVFAAGGEAFTTGLWEREPDTWAFERAYDEVAVILKGSADVETEDGEMLHVGPGDVLVTPKGTKGIWHVRETLVKFFAIYDV